MHSWGQAQADGSEDTPLRATGVSSERHCVRDLASFAHLCGATPIPALSGRTDRHRINRGGDSNANSVLCTIILVCMRYDQRTRDYVARRTTEGMSAKDIMRASSGSSSARSIGTTGAQAPWTARARPEPRSISSNETGRHTPSWHSAPCTTASVSGG
uniref:transposase n=1 Tax=Streptomyces sp. JV181 TaxID=858635 RepID=UPI002E76B2AB|nr:transposase [Streptomyces sp. JV181]